MQERRPIRAGTDSVDIAPARSIILIDEIRRVRAAALCSFLSAGTTAALDWSRCGPHRSIRTRCGFYLQLLYEVFYRRHSRYQCVTAAAKLTPFLQNTVTLIPSNLLPKLGVGS